MTELRVWAPAASKVEAEVEGTRHLMTPSGSGWWAGQPPGLAPGGDYAFVLDSGQPLPDPRSQHQPHGVHGPSRVVDHDAFGWQDSGWRGRPLAGSVIYELHVGTFTGEGTFDAAIARLGHLVELGVDFVELLPVNGFPGEQGWGYDGVDLFAVHEPYGGPEGLKRFVDAAHGHGLGVLMDVVYNHLGPSGNYLAQFGPYFTDAHQTPWGSAVNYDQADSDEVRAFAVDNALHWLADYHCDGLRLDAVHAIVDTSAVHLLEEISAAVQQLSAHTGRSYLVIAESDLNNPRLVTERQAGGFGLDAQWSDDFHHALHAVLTGERGGYYTDFGSLDTLAGALTDGYVFTGQYSKFRGRSHGRPYAGLPGHRLLGYVQDHDQVGNRARGERIGQLVSPGLAKIAAAVVLSAPFTPMLWMGEEWNAGTPWQYFTDHDDAGLAEAVRNGRRSEFRAFGWAPEDVPDPQAAETFRRSRLRWEELDAPAHREMLDWYRTLIRLRHELPELSDGDLGAVSVRYDEDARWLVLVRGGARRDAGHVAVVVNFAERDQRIELPGEVAAVLAHSAGEAAAESVAAGSTEVDLPAESVLIARLHPDGSDG